MAKKLTYEEVKKVFEDSGCTLISTTYSRNDIPLDYICECGNLSKIQYRSFRVGSRCELCRREKISKKKKYSYVEVKEIFEKFGCELLESSYQGNTVKMKYKCSCGNISKITLQSLSAGSKCNKCATSGRKEKLRLNLKQVKQIFSDNGCKLLEDDYINNKTRMKYLCKCQRESITTLDNFNAGKRCWHCAVEGRSGVNASNYRHDLTTEERHIKRCYEDYYQWRREVYERDNYTCVICCKGGRINAHHLNGYHWHIEGRTDINNAVTLCQDCHEEFHNKYGRKHNTREQFDEWNVNKRNKRKDAS